MCRKYCLIRLAQEKCGKSELTSNQTKGKTKGKTKTKQPFLSEMIENLEKAPIVESDASPSTIFQSCRNKFLSSWVELTLSRGYNYAPGDRDITQCHMLVSNQRPFDNLLGSSPRAVSAYVAMYELFYVFSLYCVCKEMNKK